MILIFIPYLITVTPYIQYTHIYIRVYVCINICIQIYKQSDEFILSLVFIKFQVTTLHQISNEEARPCKELIYPLSEVISFQEFFVYGWGTMRFPLPCKSTQDSWCASSGPVWTDLLLCYHG